MGSGSPQPGSGYRDRSPAGSSASKPSCPCHLLKPGNPLFNRWMGAEEGKDPASPERIDDKHVGCGRTGLHGNPLGSHLQLSKGPRQIEGIAEMGAPLIGHVLP